MVVSVCVCFCVWGGGLIVRSRLGVGRKRPSASSPLATQLTASQTTHHPQQPHKKQVADALLSDEGSTPEVLFFAAKILQNKIYYDFGELDPRQ